MKEIDPEYAVWIVVVLNWNRKFFTKDTPQEVALLVTDTATIANFGPLLRQPRVEGTVPAWKTFFSREEAITQLKKPGYMRARFVEYDMVITGAVKELE